MNGTAAAQPIWDDAWAAWLVQDAAQPSGWLIWNDAQSAWQPLPVPGTGPVEAVRVEPAPVAAEAAAPPEHVAPAHLHANGPLRSEPIVPTAAEASAAHPVERAVAAPSEQPAETVGDAPAAFAEYAEPTRHPYAAQPAEPQVSVPATSAPVQQVPSGPFVHPSAVQLVAAPASRVPGGATAVLALGVAAVGIGALVTLIGLVSPLFFSIGLGEPRAVAAVVNVLAVLAFPVAAAGAVLGVLQVRGAAGPGRDRALIGLGVSGTVALLLLSRGLIAVTNSAMFGTPLI